VAEIETACLPGVYIVRRGHTDDAPAFDPLVSRNDLEVQERVLIGRIAAALRPAEGVKVGACCAGMDSG
jgi:hypothetical protein